MNRRRHEALASGSDRELVAASRRGDTAAYAELWRRHRDAAIRTARAFTTSLEAEDLVSEAYLAVLAAIRDGGGPTGDGFRPYLYTVLRNLARRWGSGRREIAVDELPEPEDDAPDLLGSQLGSLDRGMVRLAFESLPQRWREVLWYTEVEGMSAAQTAPLVGLGANATAALAYRAREGLRQAWLQEHVAHAQREGECGWVLARLGEHSRDGLGKRAEARMDRHLATCASCRDVALEVGQVNRQLALVLLPLVLGAGPAAAWLAAPAGVAVAAVATGGAALALAAIAAVGVVGGVLAGPSIGIAAPPAPDEAVAAAPSTTIPGSTTPDDRAGQEKVVGAPEPGTGAPVGGGSGGTGGLGALDGTLDAATGTVGGLVGGLTGGLVELDADVGLGSGSAEVGASVGGGLVDAGVGVGGESLLDVDLGVAGVEVEVQVGGQGGLLGLGLLGL